MKGLSLLLLAASFLVGCSFSVADISTVPDAPTFDRDVQPLMADHCVLCHGDPAGRGAPDDFRLDVYDRIGGKPGARAKAGEIVEVVDDDEMPPAAAWGDGVGPNGKELLRRWLKRGAPR